MPSEERSPEGGSPAATDADALFEQQRGRLLGLAYRMLGTRSDAEDVVQDAWLRWSAADTSGVTNVEAYVVRTVTRLCIDRLRSARARREVYVGPWLPEPVLDADRLSAQSAAELADDLSFALLVALERLTAPERAAFLLHDVFDTPYGEIGATLERSEAACRKLVSRARRALRANREAEPDVSKSEHRRLLEGFVEAAATGDVDAFRALLADDVVAYTDGGGRVAAALNPIFGADKVTRFILSLARKRLERGAQVRTEMVTLNGLPGLELFVDESLDQTLSLEVHGGRVQRLFIVRNPDKLGAVARGEQRSG